MPPQVQNQDGYNKLIGLGYSPADAAKTADATKPNPNFNPVYQKGNIPSGFSGTYRSAETGQDITLQGGQQQPTPPPNPAQPGQMTPEAMKAQGYKYNIYTGQSLSGGPASGASTGQQAYNGTQPPAPNRYQAGFQTASSSGTPAPTSAGAARSAVDQYSPPTAEAYNPAQTDIQLASSKAHQQYMNDYAQSMNTMNQQQSFTDIYKQLSEQLGISSLNTDLMNTKNIIDGTEQDIRNEVNKAGGFATQSQVLALTDARNKSLIKNYNTLLQTRDNAMQNLTTMVGLAEKDRAYAQQRIDSQLNFDKENIAYADKATANAQQVYKTMQQSEGWDGIYKAALASRDPQAIAKVNATMGPGFDLFSVAKQDALDRQTKNSKDSLDITSKQLGITKDRLDIQKTSEDSGIPNPAKANKPGFNEQGVKYNPSIAQNEVIAQWKASNMFGADGAVAPATYKQARAWWVQQGLNAASFDDVFGQYANYKIANQYK